MTWSDCRAIALAAGLALSLAACAGPDPGTSDAPATAMPTPTARARVATHLPLVVDPLLLGILPKSVAGVALQPSPETAAGMISNADLGMSASGVAVGVVVAAGNSKGDDLAISTVVRLRPGVYTQDFFDQWRHAYDAAACAPAGGVSSHIRQLIGLHAVEVTVCGQGARTYNTHLADDILVSITAVGDRKFGDLVMAGLRE